MDGERPRARRVSLMDITLFGTAGVIDDDGCNDDAADGVVAAVADAIVVVVSCASGAVVTDNGTCDGTFAACLSSSASNNGSGGNALGSNDTCFGVCPVRGTRRNTDVGDDPLLPGKANTLPLVLRVEDTCFGDGDSKVLDELVVDRSVAEPSLLSLSLLSLLVATRVGDDGNNVRAGASCNRPVDVPNIAVVGVAIGVNSLRGVVAAPPTPDSVTDRRAAAAATDDAVGVVPRLLAVGDKICRLAAVGVAGTDAVPVVELLLRALVAVDVNDTGGIAFISLQ